MLRPIFRGLLAVCAGGAGVILAVGCEDPPPPTPAGAFALTLQDSPAADCNLSTHDSSMGLVGKSGEPDLISDGAKGAVVTCSVKANAKKFDISADLENNGPILQITVNGISTSNDSAANAIEGFASYVSTDTGGDLYSSPACKFWIEPNDAQYAKAGEAWLSFSCDAVTNAAATCKIINGFVALKKCDGAVNEDCSGGGG